ncbi:hypothetical protein GCM10027456_19100 [Kineosporia babensis]
MDRTALGSIGAHLQGDTAHRTGPPARATTEQAHRNDQADPHVQKQKTNT